MHSPRSIAKIDRPNVAQIMATLQAGRQSKCARWSLGNKSANSIGMALLVVVRLVPGQPSLRADGDLAAILTGGGMLP
jgi:hypothetical protein